MIFFPLPKMGLINTGREVVYPSRESTETSASLSSARRNLHENLHRLEVLGTPSVRERCLPLSSTSFHFLPLRSTSFYLNLNHRRLRNPSGSGKVAAVLRSLLPRSRIIRDAAGTVSSVNSEELSYA